VCGGGGDDDDDDDDVNCTQFKQTVNDPALSTSQGNSFVTCSI
jgi:hypothetical protein